MKKVKNSFKIAFLVSLSLNFAGMLFTYFYHGGWEEVQKDLVRVYPISLLIFFFPPFMSLYLFEKDKKFFFQFLKPAVLSFIVIFLTVFFSFSTFKGNKPSYNFFPAIFNGIIAFFLSVFFSIIQFIQQNKKDNINKLKDKVHYDVKKIVLIPTVASIIYAIIFYVNYRTINMREGTFYFLLQFIVPGVIITFTTFYLITFLYKNSILIMRKLYLILMYVLFTTCVPIVTFFWYDTTRNSEYSMSYIIKKTLQMIIVFSPYFLFIISFVHLYFLQLLKKQETAFIKQESLESQLNYQQLKNQLSPHFLFNNINVLTALIEENPKKAVDFSESLSAIYRYFLEQEKQDVVLLKDEIKFANDYLFLLQSRFEKGLSFTFDVENSSEEKYIVATTLQQVLENVIKHNEVSLEKPINVSIFTDEDFLVVKNNCNPKITEEKGMKKGIENIKKRYVYFSDTEIIIESNRDFYKIKLPLLKQ